MHYHEKEAFVHVTFPHRKLSETARKTTQADEGSQGACHPREGI